MFVSEVFSFLISVSWASEIFIWFMLMIHFVFSRQFGSVMDPCKVNFKYWIAKKIRTYIIVIIVFNGSRADNILDIEDNIIFQVIVGDREIDGRVSSSCQLFSLSGLPLLSSRCHCGCCSGSGGSCRSRSSSLSVFNVDDFICEEFQASVVSGVTLNNESLYVMYYVRSIQS